jgi:hypothetical protein
MYKIENEYISFDTKNKFQISHSFCERKKNFEKTFKSFWGFKWYTLIMLGPYCTIQNQILGIITVTPRVNYFMPKKAPCNVTIYDM